MENTMDSVRDITHANVGELAERWWALPIRGVAAIIFGIVCLAAPTLGMLALLTIFGVYALIDGALSLTLAYRSKRAGHRWGALLFEGIMSLVAAAIAFFWPAVAGLGLVVLIGVWAVVRGVSEIATAIRLRKEIKGEWLMAFMGVLSVGLGVAFLMSPSSAMVALMLWIGAYALVFGVLLIALGFKVKSWAGRHDRTLPTGGVPTPG